MISSESEIKFVKHEVNLLLPSAAFYTPWKH